MAEVTGYFVDWGGKARSPDAPGGGYRCEVDTVARYVERMLSAGLNLKDQA